MRLLVYVNLYFLDSVSECSRPCLYFRHVYYTFMSYGLIFFIPCHKSIQNTMYNVHTLYIIHVHICVCTCHLVVLVVAVYHEWMIPRRIVTIFSGLVTAGVRVFVHVHVLVTAPLLKEKTFHFFCVFRFSSKFLHSMAFFSFSSP